MIAQRLTMRAAVERAPAAGEDAWGQPAAAAFAPVGTLACFVWTPQARELRDGDKTAELLTLRGLFALAADLREGDEIAQVTSRAGVVLVPGRLRVEGPVQFKHTHLEATLKRVG